MSFLNKGFSVFERILVEDKDHLIASEPSWQKDGLIDRE